MAGSERTPAGTPRGGARRAAKPKRSFRPELLGLPLGSLAALAAWAALVWVAVDAGRKARGGDSGKWIYLGGASLAAALCLFLCLWLATLTLRRIGILEDTRRPEHGHRH